MLYAIATASPSTGSDSMAHVWATDPTARRVTRQRYTSLDAAKRAIERHRPRTARRGFVYLALHPDAPPMWTVAL